MPLVLVARAVSLLPWSSLRRGGALIGVLVGSVLRVRRAHVEASIDRAGFSDAPSVARQMYASLGTGLLEFLWMVGDRRARWPAVLLTERARAAFAVTDEGVRASRGLVIATAHTGNWDLVGCAAAGQGIKLTVLTKRLHVGWLDRFWQRERASRGLALLRGEGALREATRALGHAASVVVLIDQAPERRVAVTQAPFLGQTAYHDLSPAILAARTRARLVLALGRRNADGTHTVDVPLILEPPPRPSRAWVEHATQRLNQALEAFVREHPSQWLWLHRRWKGLPNRAEREVAVSVAVC